MWFVCLHAIHHFALARVILVHELGLIIERILILVRNVLHIPPDENEKNRPDNEASVHDQVLIVQYHIYILLTVYLQLYLQLGIMGLESIWITRYYSVYVIRK